MADDIIDVLVRLRGGAKTAAEARAIGRAIDDIGDEAEGADRKVEGLNRTLLATRSSKIAGGVSDTLFTMSGRLKLISGLAVATAPAIIGLASSLTAAAGGAALLGGAGLGALGVGLGGVGIIGAGAVANMKKVQTALDAYRLAVKQFGRDSDQAATAHEHLDAVIAQFGGRSVLQAIRGVEALRFAWNKQTGAARSALGKTFRDAIFAASRLLPTFADVTNRSAAAVHDALLGMFKSFSGPEARGTLSAFGDAFVRLSGPLGRGFTDLLWAVARALRVALPYVVKGVDAFAEWAHNLRESSSNGQGLIDFVGMLVGNFRSWLGLIGAVGRVLGALFGASVDSGQNLVDSLTGVLNHFADWINKAKAAGDATRFFNGWAEALKGVAQGIGTALTIAYYALKPFADIIVWLGPALGPVTSALAALTIGVYAFRAGMLLANIALKASPLTWIVTGIFLVVAAVVTMYNKWAWFRHAIDGIWAWLKVAGPEAAHAIANAFKDAVKWIKGVVDWLKRAQRNYESFLGTKGHDPIADALGFSKLRGALGLGHRAAGGPVHEGRPYVVGEKRPELFVPDRPGHIAPSVPTVDPTHKPPPQELHLMLKSEHGRTLAEWVTQVATTAAARA